MQRRELLMLGGKIALCSSVLSTVIRSAVAADEVAGASEVCADPKHLDVGQNGLRESLKYTEHSADPQKTCANCQLFEAKGTCGYCQIFMGPANAKGHCDSWSLKG